MMLMHRDRSTLSSPAQELPQPWPRARRPGSAPSAASAASSFLGAGGQRSASMSISGSFYLSSHSVQDAPMSSQSSSIKVAVNASGKAVDVSVTAGERPPMRMSACMRHILAVAVACFCPSFSLFDSPSLF